MGETLTWWDLKCFVEWLPRGAAFRRHDNPDWEWDLSNHLAALRLDALHGGNWQRAGDPEAPKPDPFPRPGARQKQATEMPRGIPLGQIKDELARRRARLVG